MNPDHSRRNFLKFAPGTIALFSIAQSALAQNPPAGGATANPNNNHPSGSGGGGGGGGFGGGRSAGPAGHDGDFQPGKVTGMGDRQHLDHPAKPKKDLAANQKSMREDVQQLVRSTQELKKAIEEFGPQRALSADMIGKTKEIEKLAHDIAELAKG
jgi:hypothetical protein